MVACVFRLLILVPLLIGIVGATKSASAQAFLDLYGGIAMTADDNVNAERLFSFGTDESATRSVAYDPSFTAGGRMGVFHEWVGLALDVSYFQADGNNVEHTIVSLTPMLLVRARLLQSDDMPQGRLQPYLGVGPGIFFVDQKVDFRPDITSPIDLFHIKIGVDARAGLRWLFAQNIGLFGEYRLTYFKTDSSNDDNAIFFSESHVNASLTTHHFLGGIAFSF
jgi:hypothetical protein